MLIYNFCSRLHSGLLSYNDKQNWAINILSLIWVITFVILKFYCSLVNIVTTFINVQRLEIRRHIMYESMYLYVYTLYVCMYL